MAANLAPGNILAVSVICTRNQQTSFNVIHGLVRSASGGATDQDLANILSARLAPLYLPYLTQTAVFWGVQIQILKPVLLVAVYSKSGSDQGGALGNALPPQVSGLVTLESTAAGRGRKGRMYIPFPADSTNGLQGQPTPNYQLGCLSIGEVLIGTQDYATTGTNGIGMTYGTYSRKTNTLTPTNNAVAGPYWATQRRRGDYGRANRPPGE